MVIQLIFCMKREFLYTKNKKYLDLVCGSAVTNLGHGHKAHKEQLKV